MVSLFVFFWSLINVFLISSIFFDPYFFFFFYLSPDFLCQFVDESYSCCKNIGHVHYHLWIQRVETFVGLFGFSLDIIPFLRLMTEIFQICLQMIGKFQQNCPYGIQHHEKSGFRHTQVAPGIRKTIILMDNIQANHRHGVWWVVSWFDYESLRIWILKSCRPQPTPPKSGQPTDINRLYYTIWFV